MKHFRIFWLAAILTTVALSAHAEQLSLASKPDQVGFSAERLDRIRATFQTDVDKGAIPGAVVLIARGHKIALFEAIGFQNRENKEIMKRDAIFRIASMSKPLASVAAMMLVEEGKIQLLDPVSRYLPEMKNLQVGVEKINETTGNRELVLEPTQREMTIQDLLRHTSGLTYGIFGKSLVKQVYLAANLFDPKQTLAEFVSKISKLPLAFQPGTTWEYSHSTDVLGRVVEIVSGQSFDRFIADRITNPLGLADTGFYVPQEKLQRLAEPQIDPASGKRPSMADVSSRPNYMSGGAGMVSTAADYYRFAQMLLNGGQVDGIRLLSPKTVEYMTSDHLWPDVLFSPTTLDLLEPLGIAPTPKTGQTFGLGFMIRTQTGRNQMLGTSGTFYWVGIWGTAFWVDPKEQLVAVLMVQAAPAQARYYRSLFRNLVYQAIIE
jgi:CubicO group peptidase (beta-lactamase class C family)